MLMEKLTDMIWNEETPCNDCEYWNCPFEDETYCNTYMNWLDGEDDLDE